MDDRDDAEVKKKVLRDQLPYLRQNLGDPSRYITYLVQGGLLDSCDTESIRSKATSKEKLEDFLKLLIKERNDASAFDVFVDALLEERVQSKVARRLRRTLEDEKEAIRNIDATVSLDNGIQYIRDIVGDQFSKDDMIDAIKYCNMDAAAALNHLFEKSASDVSTPMNSHDPATTQSAAVTDKVQPSPTCHLTPRTSYIPTTANDMKEHHVQRDSPVTKQSASVVPSSSQSKPVAKSSTSPSTRSIGTATPNLICPFSDPKWNITVQSQKFDHNGGTLHISEHDIDIVIPKLAISQGDVVEVQAAVILSGPYKTPLGYDPISVTVWLGASYKFNKLIRISIPHCVIINGPQDINGLVVLTATDKEFTVNANSRRLSQAIEHTNCYCYEVNNPLCDYYTDNLHGNSICLARRSLQLTTLSIMVFYWKICNCQSADKLSAEFHFCYNLKYCVKSIKKAYKTRYSVKPCISQWNVEIDSRQCQKLCLSHSTNVPGTPSVTRRCLTKVAIHGLDFQYFQLQIKNILEEETNTVFLPRLVVSFIRGEQDSMINFRVDVECDGVIGSQKCFRASMKLDKMSPANHNYYDNLPLINQNHDSDRPTTAIATAASSAFIVYAKEDNDPHGEQVLCLSNLLTKCGIQCDIDLYHINENIMDWSFWVGKNLEYHIASQHSHIILVCSPTMIATLEERNDNARVEMVAAHIDRLTLRHHLEDGAQKVLPLFINDPLANCVPPSLSGKTCYHFPYDKLVNEIPENATAKQILDHPDFASLRSLVASMTRQQEIPVPNVAQIPQVQSTEGAPPTGASTTSNLPVLKGTNPVFTSSTTATMAHHVQDNMSSSAATGNVIVNHLYMVQAGHSVSFASSFEQPKCSPIECDVKSYNCLQPFATDIAALLDVDTILVWMIKYGLLTPDQQDYLSNLVYTPTNKKRKLCSIILSLNSSCVKNFLKCLSETSGYDPHKQLLQKIRDYSSTV